MSPIKKIKELTKKYRCQMESVLILLMGRRESSRTIFHTHSRTQYSVENHLKKILC